ncbi:MAG: acyl-ACP--UDP-N-acetylglucosamine O-acyltransferase [Phenylobacterium sp.]|uniref:acyl-ACP--UDP-N-acetylglucosamine O-acyltransferase n=1 Tax=Phenylobacterium sp. TaxID=1871053 RepID=UPI001B6A93D6|nr:acyl-ACP--UDP-N-acetylglucosamine O-acyltransferase [Phenylobacterium sp.]MBP7649354.1 acyl-ACP--UDP-N-acetylglucosamine O-acyltransferase [Phenylobacterium sp.]MBP7816430.1 acyl-ACP--UDP-N-acetylglucosamine O-acyltransferase [Phenylobacterium sp.]MBP9230352.1 acyl-ACP--UDP-N-acetylglucosamine O-acyltransferase [Phenylobacterium sp.]
MSRIHPTAVIASGAQIAADVEIGAYAVIGPQVRLASRNVVGPHVVIEGATEIGEANRFLQFCAIGAGPQVDGWAGEAGALVIGSNNIFREFVTVHASTGPEPTKIGSRNMIMTGAHVAHDCALGDDIRLANAATLGGHVEIADFAQVSGLTAIHQHSRIGTHAFVAGGSIVTQDVPPYCLVQGDRARLAGLNSVGLKRAGFSAVEIAELRRAYRTLFLGTGPMADRLAAARLGAGARTTALVAFLESSGRGCISTSRSRPKMAA